MRKSLGVSCVTVICWNVIACTETTATHDTTDAGQQVGGHDAGLSGDLGGSGSAGKTGGSGEAGRADHGGGGAGISAGTGAAGGQGAAAHGGNQSPPPLGGTGQMPNNPPRAHITFQLQGVQ
jgi:hypothetical protein